MTKEIYQLELIHFFSPENFHHPLYVFTTKTDTRNYDWKKDKEITGLNDTFVY